MSLTRLQGPAEEHPPRTRILVNRREVFVKVPKGASHVLHAVGLENILLEQNVTLCIVAVTQRNSIKATVVDCTAIAEFPICDRRRLVGDRVSHELALLYVNQACVVKIEGARGSQGKIIFKSTVLDRGLKAKLLFNLDRRGHVRPQPLEARVGDM